MFQIRTGGDEKKIRESSILLVRPDRDGAYLVHIHIHIHLRKMGGIKPRTYVVERKGDRGFQRLCMVCEVG